MKSVAEIIDLLEHVRKRKEMHFRKVNAEAVENFVHGFLVALNAVDVALPWAAWTAASEARGWRSAAKSALTLMQDKGMADEAIVDEQFAILADTIRLLFPSAT